MSLTYFPVTAVLKAVNTDSSLDADGNPDTQFISSTITFTPSVDQVFSTLDDTVYRLEPITGRTNPDDGALKTIDGHTVSLVANSTALDLDELIYSVAFTNVVYDKGDRDIEGFRFLAPTAATAVDLATVERIPD
jgi:hypothetical protein